MATNIDINDITNATEANNGTGVFDKLIRVAFLHISKEVDENRLTQSGAGEVYAAAIQSAMSQAIQFVLQEKQLEAQIDLTIAQKDELLLNGVKDRELKDTQKEVAYAERVIKDKEAAILGMDNAIKIAQTSKAADDTYIYVPQYKEL